MSQSEQDRFNEAMQDAVQNAIQVVWPQDLVSKFIVVVETIDGEDSERTLIIGATPKMKTWEALGMLTYSLQKEQAFAVADSLEQTDE